ncbi:MAG: endonuclease [Tannerella sp.]|jgi:predicted extracellular nuclease|nr:endonuclease [Tannerella sp.]
MMKIKNKLSLRKTTLLIGCCLLILSEYTNSTAQSQKRVSENQQPKTSGKSPTGNRTENNNKDKDRESAKANCQDFRVMFYNVENLFDTYDDPHKNDNEFLPNGAMHWTPSRYYRHLRKTAQVISAIGEWGTPAICGLCEVENDSVLVHLLNRTPLQEQHYSYCITTGNDARGINNALIYQRDKFRYLGHSSERIKFTNKNKRSRDILHVWGELISGERLDIFVCHFPSRLGGEKESEPDRADAAKCLRKLCDSIFKINGDANIIAMGDFNDNPYDKSIQTLIKGSKAKYNLINLFGDPGKLNFGGSHKFRGEWSQLDQMMISPNWNKYLRKGSPQIFARSFLLSKKNSRGEQTPLRKYAGRIYKNGYSDHLPIVADFSLPFPRK